MSFALTFEKIIFKNFMSVGNAGLEYNLNSGKKILITGRNGNGKSLLQEAIIFALYGKSYRKINKPLLVNTFNKRDCLVRLNFSANGNAYVVERGISPNIFTIQCNGKKVDSQTSSDELQDWFEQNVLHMNYQTAIQVVILGQANFTPFMKLDAAKRREVVESLTNTSIYTAMAKILKQKIDTNQQNIYSIRADKHAKEDFLETIEKLKSCAVSQKEDELDQCKKTAISLIADKKVCEGEIAVLEGEIKEEQDLTSQISKENGDIRVLDSAQLGFSKKIEFFKTASVCSECAQEVPHTHSEAMMADYSEKLNLNFAVKTAKLQLLDQLNKQLKVVLEKKRDLQQKKIKLASLSTQITSLKSTASKLLKEIENLKNNSDDVVAAQAEKALSELDALNTQLEHETKESLKFETCAKLLKDNGIKASVIKQSIPTINALINKYLSIFEFFVTFTFDENFNETISGAGYDSLTYNSFSMGQRTRIDLAMLFTWRDIARMGAKADTNLLILDEVLDSAVDPKGTDDVINLIEKCLQNQTVFVISHKGDQLVERFDTHMRVEMEGGFSKVCIDS